MTDSSALAKQLKLAAFELSCRTLLKEFNEEDLPEMTEWMASEDSPLPERFNILPDYNGFIIKPSDLKKAISSITIEVYGALVTGASTAIEYGVMNSLSMAELEEEIDTL